MAKGKGGFIGQDGLNAPDAPTGVSGTAGDSQVTVSWTAPSDVGGSAITGYNVTGSNGVDLGLPGLNGLSYTDKSFSLQSQDNEPWKIAFKTDGTKMYLAGGNTTTVYQYALSTAWDISTASYESKSYGFSSQVNFPRGLAFKSDGTKVFIGGYSNATSDNRMFQYSLSTAWDISTASYDSVNFSFASQISSLQDVKFKPDGTKMYGVSYNEPDEVIYQYALSTAYDLSTASYESKSLTLGANEVYAAFTSDGATLYTGNFSEVVTAYSLSTPWDVSTGSATGATGSLASQLTSLTGIELKSDDLVLYAQGQDTDTIFQYSLDQYPTASPVTITGLTNGTGYTFNVWAINAFGWSVASDPSGTLTPEQPQLGLSFGGDPDNNSAITNRIEFINIGTLGNATDFGDLTQVANDVSGASSSTRGLKFGGTTNPFAYLNVIDYFTMRSAGNATDYGDLTRTRYETAAFSNNTRWLCAGSGDNAIDYRNIASTGNASDFGDITQATGTQKRAGVASPTRGIFGGGSGPTNVMEYVTIASTGNSADFGDLASARQWLMGCSSNTRGFFMGGESNSSIEYVTIASTGNSQSWGSLASTIYQAGATSSTTRGVIFGGSRTNPVRDISYFDITSAGDIADFGDLAAIVRTNAGCGTNHGGIS